MAILNLLTTTKKLILDQLIIIKPLKIHIQIEEIFYTQAQTVDYFMHLMRKQEEKNGRFSPHY